MTLSSLSKETPGVQSVPDSRDYLAEAVGIATNRSAHLAQREHVQVLFVYAQSQEAKAHHLEQQLRLAIDAMQQTQALLRAATPR